MPVLLGLSNQTGEMPYYYSPQIGALWVLLPDSPLTGEIDGELGAAQLPWPAEELHAPAPGGDVEITI